MFIRGVFNIDIIRLLIIHQKKSKFDSVVKKFEKIYGVEVQAIQMALQK